MDFEIISFIIKFRINDFGHSFFGIRSLSIFGAAIDSLNIKGVI